MNKPDRAVAHKVNSKPRTSDVAFDSTTFESLRVLPLVLQGLKEAGFEKPSPVQLKSIPLGKCGFDLVVQAKSGTGKTCVFTVLILENINTESNCVQAIVLAPTREIAMQIWEVMSTVGKHLKDLRCYTFIGGLSMEDDRKKLKRCHVVIATPGRLKHLIEEEGMELDRVRMFVLDEADRLLDLDFQESINWIYKCLPPSKQMLTLSATYPKSLEQHVTQYMESAVIVRLNSTDPALFGIKQYCKIVAHHPVQHQLYMRKLSQLIAILNTVDFNQCLVFSNYHTRSEAITSALIHEKFPAVCITGTMDQQKRLAAISQLKNFQCRILVSTDLTSRGIDAENVNLVINMDIPNNYETYLHRIGRGGRFGSYSAAVTLAAEGNEFEALQEIERLCNTKIVLLPEPIPNDLIQRPMPMEDCNSVVPESCTSDILQTAEMHIKDEPNVQQHSSLFEKDSTVVASTAKNDGLNAACDLSNEQDIRSQAFSQNNADSQENDCINFNELLSHIFTSKNSKPPMHSSTLTGLFSGFKNVIDLEKSEEEGIFSAINQQEESCSKSENVHIDAVKNGDLTPSCKYDGVVVRLLKEMKKKPCKAKQNLSSRLMEMIPEKHSKILDLFGEVGVSHKSGDDAHVTSLEITSQDNKKHKSPCHKYTREELYRFKNEMPQSCTIFSISHLNIDVIASIAHDKQQKKIDKSQGKNQRVPPVFDSTRKSQCPAVSSRLTSKKSNSPVPHIKQSTTVSSDISVKDNISLSDVKNQVTVVASDIISRIKSEIEDGTSKCSVTSHSSLPLSSQDAVSSLPYDMQPQFPQSSMTEISEKKFEVEHSKSPNVFIQKENASYASPLNLSLLNQSGQLNISTNNTKPCYKYTKEELIRIKNDMPVSYELDSAIFLNKDFVETKNYAVVINDSFQKEQKIRINKKESCSEVGHQNVSSGIHQNVKDDTTVALDMVSKMGTENKDGANKFSKFTCSYLPPPSQDAVSSLPFNTQPQFSHVSMTEVFDEKIEVEHSKLPNVFVEKEKASYDSLLNLSLLNPSGQLNIFANNTKPCYKYTKEELIRIKNDMPVGWELDSSIFLNKDFVETKNLKVHSPDFAPQFHQQQCSLQASTATVGDCECKVEETVSLSGNIEMNEKTNNKSIKKKQRTKKSKKASCSKDSQSNLTDISKNSDELKQLNSRENVISELSICSQEHYSLENSTAPYSMKSLPCAKPELFSDQPKVILLSSELDHFKKSDPMSNSTRSQERNAGFDRVCHPYLAPQSIGQPDSCKISTVTMNNYEFNDKKVKAKEHPSKAFESHSTDCRKNAGPRSPLSVPSAVGHSDSVKSGTNIANKFQSILADHDRFNYIAKLQAKYINHMIKFYNSK